MPLDKLLAFTKDVGDLADKPNATMSAAEVKAQFDAAPNELRLAFNQLIDDLSSVVEGDSGADNIAVTAIAGLTGATVQSILEALKNLDDENRAYLLSQIQGATLGQIPDGTVTAVKLSADAKQASNITVEDSTGLFISVDVEGALKESIEKANSAFQSANDGKTAVASAVTAKGVTASPTDTFSALATKIGQISTGKKWASGTATSGGSTVPFQYASDSNTGNISPITISGLNFVPSFIILSSTTDDTVTVYRTNGKVYRNIATATPNVTAITTFSTTAYKGDVSPAYVTSSGFCLPVNGFNMPFNWIAFE